MTVVIKDFVCIDEFWDYLSPIGGFFESFGSPIFRGQGDANWKLVPSILRSMTIKRYAAYIDSRSHADFTIFMEHRILSGFLYYCDQMGHRIPNDSREFREAMEFFNFADKYGISTDEWPSLEYYNFIALAQHHGVPTRLLDWTTNPLTAIYFAASQALAKDDLPEKISIWAFDTKELKSKSEDIVFLSMPGSTSVNLAAQRGVFTFHRQKSTGRNTILSIETIEEDSHRVFSENESLYIYQITTDSQHVPELLKRCERYGISAASLFPGFDGAAKSAIEWKRARKLSGEL